MLEIEAELVAVSCFPLLSSAARDFVLRLTTSAPLLPSFESNG